jgi:Sec-independent protein translocase protein TatA
MTDKIRTNSDQELVFTGSKSLVVSTKKDRQIATDLWDAIRAFRKQAETQKEEVTRPLKDAFDNAKKPFDIFIKECKHHEDVLQHKMNEYDQEQERLVQLEAKKLQAKIDKQNEKIAAKAEAKGVVPVFKETPMFQEPVRSMDTQAGTTQTRQIRITYSVKPGVDAHVALMRDYPSMFEINKVKFNAHAKAGMFIGNPWVIAKQEFVYVQRAKSGIPIEEDGEGL